MSRAIVLLLAHPDDETFVAGTIAKSAAAGVRVGLVCATRGERGTTGNLCTIEELPAVREAEVRESAHILGIHELEVLPFQDQQLARAPTEEVRRRVVRIIRRMRPRIAVTFDPEGTNQHSDHMAISRFAMGGIAAAADARWYPEEGEPWQVESVLWPPPVRVWDLGKIAHPVSHPGIDYLIDITGQRAVKEAALRAHRTQWPGLSKLFLGQENAMSWEAFRVGWGARPAIIPATAVF